MEIIESLNRICPISNASMQELSHIILEKHYPKGHLLLKMWQINHDFHFIVKGSGRVFYLKDGIEITDYFALDLQFIGGVESLFTQELSHKAIELTEDSLVQSFSYRNFEILCNKYHDIEKLGRKMAVYGFLEGQKRIESIRFMSASERYMELEKKHPGISNRVPLKYIASYLGTSQVSLSRVRKGIQ